MNPSSSASTSYPFPPNPPFFFHSLPQPPPPPPQIRPPASLDLSTSLSSLTHLLSLSHKTLNSLSSLLPLANPQNSNFVSCLHNPHHLFPPESLFFHSLRCPSPLFEDLPSLFHSLHYPKTLTPQNPSKNLVIQESNSELRVSIDSYYNEFASNYFYQDCPGVVYFNRFDNANRSFLLPSVLSVECTDVSGSSCEGGIKGFDETEFRILPSDSWAVRREVEGWVDFPTVNSYAVFCAILQLNMIKWSDLNMWLIFNSPRYGVVIDVYMRDHISVLFSLCLKAIRKEALSFLGHGVGKENLSFHCPIQGQVLQWIVSQLSVLYGEMNAKFFVIHVFKQCLLEVANRVLLPLESNLKQAPKELDKLGDVKLNEHFETSLQYKVGLEVDESVDTKVILVSQVAASVAALHERSLLEAKIKQLREFQPVPRYQMTIEHEFVSKRADEVRNTRSDYRAIIDHDGLPRKPSSNQETSKLKTRQELLAEERDYKRRRMSYRGKKLKRTPLQVMRDIIDEYTDEIKLAGGIGCFEKGPKEEEMSSETPYFSDVTTRDDDLGNSLRKSSEAIIAIRPNHQKQLQSDSTTSKKAATHDHDKQQGWGFSRQHLEDQRSNSRDRHVRDNYSGSKERHRSHHESSHDQSSHRKKHDAESTSARCHERRPSSKSSYKLEKSSYSVNSTGQKDEKMDGRRRDLRNFGKHKLEIQEKNGFEDRYDPAESYGDDVDK